MKCVYCGDKTVVSNSRPGKLSPSTWRRRACNSCHAIFTTREQADYSATLRVQNQKGSLEPFLEAKLLISVYSSLSHRKAAYEDAGNLTATIVASLLSQQQKGLLSCGQIIKTTEEILDRFDEPAAIHYKAHHSIS
jgi:transcriptional regulator NrdR family protein